ncbi:SusD/RagB family nutrient-binding outer membrane lipoprotein [Spirosoma sp. KUDC1026]|uniref:SusD/RagB family nutrient-binding outer membrane lipoprotein n=1 Tax=Spirosoma sp. KUDC1026 TaxID=2745947 RepID=UPI00159BECBE|nr:SusD/RagB family nutrient-binding outer membrane lipoprotein [Spirosoma sp. KUDC1026]QKZ14417.1 SusD/RagB family nutrient-binding outer membrane lipoprotein [Spirosoma sp. KUDC1026]
MFNIKKITVGVLVALLVVTSGCKEFLDINNNPNQVTAATPELVLPDALAASARYIQTSFPFLNLWMGYWNWSGNYSIGTSDKNYQFTNSFGSGIWDNAYLNLKNYNYIDTQGAELNQPVLQGMAKIMKALHFQILVDTYGNIPYTEALAGVSTASPKYDDQVAVYEDLFNQIDAGLALFDQADQLADQGATVLNPGTNDIMFHGDLDLWREFANTLKLRMLLRQSEKSDRQSFIQAQLTKIKASGYGFLGAGESATVNPGYTNSTNQQNPFFGNYGETVTGTPTELNNQYKANKYGVDFYQTTNDPRLGRYYYPVGGTGTTFNATYFGTIAPVVNSLVSAIGPALLDDASQDAVILSSHESLFLQAEAAQRGWITGTPKTLYQSAISESFINVGLTAAQATTYYSQAVNNVGFDASTNKIEAIITQKWASLNGFSPFESWSDYRRLGYPNVPISQDPSTSIKQIPVRLLYPQSEYNYNAANVNAQGTVSQFTTKIFWEK